MSNINNRITGTFNQVAIFDDATGLVTGIDTSDLSNINLGNVSNIHIAGGNSGQVLTTDGTGNLSWATGSGGGNGTPGGSNTQVQFNDSGSFAGSANFTFNKTSNVLSLTGLATSAITGGGGNLVIGNTNTTNIVFGGSNVSNMIFASPVQLGNVANIHILGGNSGQFLQTDGNGNLSFANVTATAGGSDGAIQINDKGALAGANGLVYSAGTLQANGFTATANIDSLGITNLGVVGNVSILGGSTGQVLTTDGTGNLSWTTGSGGGNGSGGWTAYTNQQNDDTLITGFANSSTDQYGAYFAATLRDSTTYGAPYGGNIGNTTYITSSNAVFPSFGNCGVVFPVNTTYDSIEVEVYLPAFTATIELFSPGATAVTADRVMFSQLGLNGSSSNSPYDGAVNFPPFQGPPGDGWGLEFVSLPEITVTSGAGTTTLNISVGPSTWRGVSNDPYTGLGTSQAYSPYLRLNAVNSVGVPSVIAGVANIVQSISDLASIYCVVNLPAGGSGGGTPGGANTQLQFNNNGTFGGVSSVTWNGSNLSLGNVANVKITGGSNGQVLTTDGTGNLTWDVKTAYNVNAVANAGPYTPNIDLQNIVTVSYAGAVSIVLPTPTANNTGSLFYIKDIWGGGRAANPITITTNGGNTIDGQASILINSDYNSLQVAQVSATNWGVL